MKLFALAVLVMAVVVSGAFAQAWSPTPMVIDAQDRVRFDNDGDDILIPFSLSGKDATIWAIIESSLYDEEKPVAVMNGFNGWHYVNGIDTTIYVSPARIYNRGADLTFPIGTHGPETVADRVNKTAPRIDAVFTPHEHDIYKFYLWGYDHRSDRELAVDFLPIGSYWEGQYLKFYPYDKAGALYEAPMLMGQLPYFLTSEGGKGAPIPDFINNATIIKWKLGQDPLNSSLLETSQVSGFESAESDRPFEEGMVGYGAGIFDLRDHDVFYFTKNYHWEQSQTVVKYAYVGGGQAVEDTDWGDYDNVYWYHPATDGDNSTHSVLYNFDDDALVMLDGGTNPVDKHDRLHVFSIDDPTDEYLDIQLDEFYMPNQPVNPSDGESRSSSELNQLFPGKRDGEFCITGDYSCLLECVDISRLIDREGELDPYTADGSGYVVWANSNGDFFFDMSPYPDPDYPEQHWACMVSEPHNANNPQRELQPPDMCGFLISYSEYTGTNSFGVYCPDGTGIELAGFADDTFATGGDNNQQRGGGEILDYGGQFDGLYMPAPIQSEPVYGSEMYLKTCWIAFDSDWGYLSAYYDYEINFGPPQHDDVYTVEDSPEPFTVAQNSPNPFNPTTTITFSLAEEGPVIVEVYNVAGQKVETLADEFMSAGSHAVTWDAVGYSAGVYFYTVRSGGFSKTMKMTLVK